MAVPISFSLTTELIRQVSGLLEDKGKIKKFLNNIPSAKSFTKNESVKKLSSEYECENLVLVLGAGVSMKYGLPDWYTLLQKLMISTIEEELNVSTVLSKLFTNIFQPSPLIAGRYLQDHFQNKNISFEESVRNSLYEGFDINNQSNLMKEIVNFCVATGTYPNLDSVITYNFDDILEQKLESIEVPVRYRPIYGIGMQPGKHLPIYHVHGYLPQNGKITKQNEITFGESIYHRQYTDVYSWNNIVQINKFRDKTCLFIGSSITDPNLRRLLDIAQKQSGKKEISHFTFKVKYKRDEIKNRLQNLLSENRDLLDEKIIADLNLDETVNFLIEIIEKFEETDMASLGVSTIWVKDWDDVPIILKEVRDLK